MVMSVCAVGVPVRHFLWRGSTHLQHLERKAQHLAGERMIAIEQHLRALDLHHVEHLLTAVVGHAAQLAADLHAGRELALGDGAHQAFIAYAEGFFGLQHEVGAVAGGLAFESGFEFGEGVAVAAVQVGLLTRFERLALCVGDAVADGDDGVFADLHKNMNQIGL